MLIAARIAVGIVALLHVQFLVLEMFLWQTPTGLKVFRQSAENAAITAVLAKNQGLYNGFLAAGLAWGILLSVQGAAHARDVICFFLGCVIVAGLYGAATAARNILFIQAVPAIVALALVLAA
ncbi:MAG: DUF1304 domain-containing protein [Deltaproteobacteria bacterium]|nr:DUF1304 domain-containing protein [Deltaproteobacteria bacterium]